MNLKMFYIKLTETTYKFCKFANNWIKNPKIKNTSVKKNVYLQLICLYVTD